MAKFQKGCGKSFKKGPPGEKAPTDHEEATEGVSEGSGEPSEGAMGEGGEEATEGENEGEHAGEMQEKSEDPASDSEHISHPRPEEGEEIQSNPGGVAKGEGDNEEMEEGALNAQAKAKRNDESIGKSLTAEDLEKSLSRLGAYANSGAKSRKSVLLAKANAGTLSKSEKTELFDILGQKGEAPAGQRLAKSVTQGLSGNPDIKKALDVSAYLAAQHDELTKSLGTLGRVMESSDTRQHEYNLVLAKAITDIGLLVKAIGAQVGAIVAQPVRSPKSQGVGMLQKGFVGTPSQGDALQKSDVLNAMEGLMVDTMSKGGSPVLDGEDLSIAIAKYEASNMISPNMLGHVRRFIKTRG